MRSRLLIGLVMAVAPAQSEFDTRLQIAWPEWAVPLPPYAIGTIASYWFIGRFLAVFRRVLRGESEG